MDQDSTAQSAQWPMLSGGPEDDFSNLLNFPPELDFQALGDGHHNSAHELATSAGAAMDLSIDAGGSGLLVMDTPLTSDSLAGMTSTSNPMDGIDAFADISNTALFSRPASSDPQTQDLQKHQQLQRHQHHHRLSQQNQQKEPQSQPQQRYRAPNTVPPTPNSIEMQGGHLSYYQPAIDSQQQRQIFEQYRRQQQKEQMNFTPLVSPAVTPLDTQFQYPDYAASTGSFSPLTSPALRAQPHSAHASVYNTVHGCETPDTSSPIDFSLDYSLPESASTSTQGKKSTRRRVSASSLKTPARAVRQSPSMKAQSKKRQPSSAVIPAKEVQSVIEEVVTQPDENRLQAVPSTDIRSSAYMGDLNNASGIDSVSPQPIGEILMPPPATARPGSAGRSPFLQPQQQQNSAPKSAGTDNGAPATPASLMQLRKRNEKQPPKTPKQQVNWEPLQEQAESAMEDIALPSPMAATNSSKGDRPPMSDDTGSAAQSRQGSVSNNHQRKASGGGLQSTDNKTTASGRSPIKIAPQNGASTETSTKPKPGTRKSRAPSTSNSTKASPALRPKFSPSIKPLLPEGAHVSAETSALLLATKSNYQNILDGTRFPGVSFPENLSTNLTSKRTSHKIAEQGRRNRINTALQEIAALLPPSTATSSPQIIAKSPNREANGVSGAGSNSPVEQQRKSQLDNSQPSDPSKTPQSQSQQQQNNSKASTVEAAIEYIKRLQKENSEYRDKLALYEGGSSASVSAGASSAAKVPSSSSLSSLSSAPPSMPEGEKTQDASKVADSAEDSDVEMNGTVELAVGVVTRSKT